MVNESMESDKETHNKYNEKMGTTTILIGGAIGTITLRDTPKEGGVLPSTPLFENIPEESNEISDLIVDDSEGSEGSIHKLLQSQNGELDKEEVKSQDENKTANETILHVLEDPELDKLDAKEDNTPWKLEDEMTEADKEYYDKIRNTKVSPEQHFKMAVLQVMLYMDMFFKSIAFEYLEKVKVSFGKLMENVKQLPSSEYLNQVDKELGINSPLSQYLNAYFGVQPGDEEALRYKLHYMYTTRYENRNDTFEEQLTRRKKVALSKLQEQMDNLRQQMLDNGDYVVPDPWRLESEEYRENRKSKSKFTSDLLDMPQESYLKEWKPNDTMPLAVTNRWELLTYHLNSIAKANRNYEHHSNSYWNKKRQKMRNDKDFIIGLNVLGLTLSTLLKCYGLVDSDNPEDMYFLNIFKDALIYQLMQFQINTNQVYHFLTQLIYRQHCDHPIGSINLFGYPASYHRILEILFQSCSILFSQEPSYRMKHHFPHLNMVETRQLFKWLSDIKSQKCGCDYHLSYPLHGSPAYMAPLPTYDQVRNEVHRETPDVGQHDLSVYYKDTIIMRILMRVHELMTPYSPILITQEKHYAYTLGTGVAFTPLEREWILKRLEDQHPSWMPDEVEEALGRLLKNW